MPSGNVETLAPSRAVLEARALQSRGISENAIYRMALGALREAGATGGTLLDVGCGVGGFEAYTRGEFSSHVCADVVRHEGLSADLDFVPIASSDGRLPFENATFDVVVALEVVVSVENPRAFARELTRVAKPGGIVLLSAPNQLSLLGLATLAVKGRFQGCQDAYYPMGITAPLEIDLLRIANECGLENPVIRYSGRGRVVFTPAAYPPMLSRWFPRACSDNLLVIGRKLRSGGEAAGR